MTQPLESHTTPDILPANIHGILTADPFLSSLESIDAAYPVHGGVAHRVYAVESGQSRFYLKIRGEHFSAIPSIACNPADIINEYRALTMFGQAAPTHFPRILSFNNDSHYMVLTDAIGKGQKMETSLLAGNVPDCLYRTYGRTLSDLQRATATITNSVRSEGDETYYETILGHRLGYRNHPVLDATIEQLSTLPHRQLILGDAAPKNIGIQEQGKLLMFFDLETAHQGNPEFDYAYALAHVLLHTMPDKDVMIQAANDYIEGYGTTTFDPQLIHRIMLSIILYRLNSVVPYPVSLNSEQKRAIESDIEHLLFDITGNESWYNIINQLIYI